MCVGVTVWFGWGGVVSLSRLFSVMYNVSIRFGISTKLLSKKTGLKKYYIEDCICGISSLE
jgi:hypothetical protein